MIDEFEDVARKLEPLEELNGFQAVEAEMLDRLKFGKATVVQKNQRQINTALTVCFYLGMNFQVSEELIKFHIELKNKGYKGRKLDFEFFGILAEVHYDSFVQH